jgi:CheY-like chemotaxis protein
VKPVDREQLRAALAALGRSITTVGVVDDDPAMVRLVSRMLRSLSRRYRMVTAHDGAAALRLFRQTRPDAVLLDLLMPGTDGYRVAEAMQHDERLARVPIVVITAKGAEQELITAPELVISRSAGLSIAEVVRYVRSVLDSSRRASQDRPAAPAV